VPLGLESPGSTRAVLARNPNPGSAHRYADLNGRPRVHCEWRGAGTATAGRSGGFFGCHLVSIPPSRSYTPNTIGHFSQEVGSCVQQSRCVLPHILGEVYRGVLMRLFFSLCWAFSAWTRDGSICSGVFAFAVLVPPCHCTSRLTSSAAAARTAQARELSPQTSCHLCTARPLPF
jgi:hypothetical protein